MNFIVMILFGARTQPPLLFTVSNFKTKFVKGGEISCRKDFILLLNEISGLWTWLFFILWKKLNKQFNAGFEHKEIDKLIN
jgi:hypothetical protein